MFRICKIGSFATKIHRASKIINANKQSGLEFVAACHIQRYYSKKKQGGDEHNCKPGEKKRDISPCKPKVVGKECRPPLEKGPCTPPPCPPGTHTIPHIQECLKPNLMSASPQPDCPWDDESDKNKGKNRNILIIGILVTMATLGALYFMAFKKKAEPAKVVKRTRRRPFHITKSPSKSRDIPKKVPYLLVGGGTASFSAFRAIKSADPTAKVLVVTNEPHFPYMRPPLSKEMWFNEDEKLVKKLIFKQWNGSERSLFYEPDDFYIACKDFDKTEKHPNGGVAVARGWNIKYIDVVERKAYLEDGVEIQYDKCLIATGATPRNLDIFENSSEKIQEKVTLYRNIFDFEELNDILKESKSIAIIGGGFLGSELACALARKGKKQNLRVFQIFREGGNMGKILPEYLSYWTTEKVKGEGVEVVSNAEVTAVRLLDNDLVITTNNGKTIRANHVIVSVGVEPNTALAEKSDLEIDPDLGGYLVNTELQARSHLYIAGDCSCFYDTKLGRRRVEHHDHAVVSGRLAGENMTGSGKPYLHQSMFWSDLGPDVGYEAIGIVDSSLPTVGVFAKATDKDNPKAVVTATDEGIRSKTEAVPKDCQKYVKKDPQLEQQLKELRKGSSMPQEGEDFGKGVIFYLRDDIVVGIVLWNVFNRMSIARQVLKDERKYDDLNEVAKLFNIHEE